jgi:hypothetical protein
LFDLLRAGVGPAPVPAARMFLMLARAFFGTLSHIAGYIVSMW